jgi:hypothetical protein
MRVPSTEGLTSGVHKKLGRCDRPANDEPSTECRSRRLPKRQRAFATALATHADTRRTVVGATSSVRKPVNAGRDPLECGGQSLAEGQSERQSNPAGRYLDLSTGKFEAIRQLPKGMAVAGISSYTQNNLYVMSLADNQIGIVDKKT